nr:phage holin family protein [Enterococcus faecalis]
MEYMERYIGVSAKNAKNRSELYKLCIPYEDFISSLAMICCAMIIDFLSGVFAAKMNPKIDFQSRIGINGILKKIAALILLIFFIPLAMTIPGNTGTGLLYVLYFGYLLMEIQSILENYQKIGIDVSLFQNFINRYSKSTMDNNKTNNSNEKEKKEEK